VYPKLSDGLKGEFSVCSCGQKTREERSSIG